MKIIEKLLTLNQYSRPGRRNGGVKAVIFHWTGIPLQRAVSTWNFFEVNCPKDRHYSSAHYIVDLNGDVYHAVPDKEIAYHCGSSQEDPASGRIYTDWARAKFGPYAEMPDANSPNNCTVGIELCVADADGGFTAETYAAAVELAAKLLKNNSLAVEDIGTHHLVVGWKDCPLLWTKHPEKFAEFKLAIKAKLAA
jgi:N-acetylmuramoyl-L-alanine amidase